MSTAQFDTSGFVGECEAQIDHSKPCTCHARKRWSDLSPFQQGYVEAMFAANEYFVEPAAGPLGFSDLAPETLARIIEDCARLVSWLEASTNIADHKAGAECWAQRAAGTFAAYGFPPLTVILGDDGKVRFAEPSVAS